MRILIVEDELKIAEPLVQIFNKNKYSADIATDGIYGLDCALTGIYDVIVLDIMLPGMNGIDVLSELRKKKIATPVILLTAKDDVRDKINGLDSGADDYLTKPFSSDELLARIRALSRRTTDSISESALTYDDLTLDMSTYTLSCGDRSLTLGIKELQIMELLIRYGERILGKEDLLIKVWGYDSDAEYNNVEVYVSFLRRKLAHLRSNVQIKTVRGAGYRLESGGGEG